MTRTPKSDLLPADLAARYHPVRLLGEGGYGRVVLAKDKSLGRSVAVKLLHTRLADEESVERFRQEALVTSRLRHPHIVEVFDLGVSAKGAVFIVYEFVEGESLVDELERAKHLPPAQVRALGRALADALEVAHRAGVLHRDVKPENVLLRGGEQPVLCDFGVARLEHGRGVQTASGIILGTAAYMAPEILLGTPPSPASDQFSLAATLYMALLGVPVYRSLETKDVLQAVSHGKEVDLAQARAADPALGACLERALDADPTRRFPDMASFGRALVREKPATARSAAQTLLLTSRRLAREPSTQPSSRRRSLIIAGIGLTLLVGLTAMSLALMDPPASTTRETPVKDARDAAEPDLREELPVARELDEALRRLTGRAPPDQPKDPRRDPPLVDEELNAAIQRSLADPADFAFRFDRLLVRLMTWLRAEYARGDWRDQAHHPLLEARNEARLARVARYLYEVPHQIERRVFQRDPAASLDGARRPANFSLLDAMEQQQLSSELEERVTKLLEELDGLPGTRPDPLAAARGRILYSYKPFRLNEVVEDIWPRLLAAGEGEIFPRLLDVGLLALSKSLSLKAISCEEASTRLGELRDARPDLLRRGPRAWRVFETRRLVALAGRRLQACGGKRLLDEITRLVPSLDWAENTAQTGDAWPSRRLEAYLDTYLKLQPLDAAPVKRRALLKGLSYLLQKWDALQEEDHEIAASFWIERDDRPREQLLEVLEARTADLDAEATPTRRRALLRAANIWLETLRLRHPEIYRAPSTGTRLATLAASVGRSLEASTIEAREASVPWLRAFLWRAHAYHPETPGFVLAFCERLAAWAPYLDD